jgi:hypothetical protein
VFGLRADVAQNVTYDRTAANPSDVLPDASKVLKDANVPTTTRNAVADTTLTALFQKFRLSLSAGGRRRQNRAV